MIRTVVSLVQAFLFLVSAFAVKDSNFKERVDWAAIGVSSTTDFSFEPIDAAALHVTEDERARCRAWFDENILHADGVRAVPAYRFAVGGQSLHRHAQDWTFTVDDTLPVGAVYRSGETTYIHLQHKKSGVTATVEATLYDAWATCEWTVWLENSAAEVSPCITGFNAADCTLDVGKSTLYVSKGSGADANDFELHRSFVNVLPMRMNANGGRTESFLPYFNLSGTDAGVVMAVGWTGQWLVKMAQTFSGVHVRACQETFRAVLEPGERVRSPLVSLTFYDGQNPLKGFNMLRGWESACVYTESAREITTGGLANEFSTETAETMIRNIGAMPQEVCDQIDFLWMDAGWYTRKESWYDSVGNWTPDPARFPNGLAPVADAAAARGMGLLLWYEPERCCAGTQVFEEASRHDGWLLQKDENVNMVNLANDDACTYLGDLISASIRDNHVGLYRQDFNFVPLPLWESADKALGAKRKGITENHYVTNLYRYLDRLLEVNPGLIIDNCASGGKRLDLEMSRRSVPLWRNDYNCTNELGENKPDVLEATQVNTYGLSFWLPLHGSGVSLQGEYADRSILLPCAQRPGYADVRQYMTGQYFPLTYGGMHTDRFLAMQYGDAAEGTALLYKRADVQDDLFDLRLNGLDPAQTYVLRSYDDPQTEWHCTGKALMHDGVSVPIPDAPKGYIFLYSIDE